MKKYLNVTELIEILKKYDGDLIPVILRDGKGHYAPLETKYIKKEKDVYFPDSNISFDDNVKFLRIGLI